MALRWLVEDLARGQGQPVEAERVIGAVPAVVPLELGLVNPTTVHLQQQPVGRGEQLGPAGAADPPRARYDEIDAVGD
ncbi:MAG: hypothetical protein OEV60_12960, partial [Actinomycetota bacterium]|nr:hypothetical protein [Actinomycetota bacterium]